MSRARQHIHALVDGTNSTTREQILSETQQIHDGTLCRHDSKIYKTWSDMATDWLSDTTMIIFMKVLSVLRIDQRKLF
jgi:hypothetical protein